MSCKKTSTDIIVFLSVLVANKETTVFEGEEAVTNLCAVYEERIAKQIIMHE